MKFKGTVKWFSHEKGYGFIACDEGPDHYVHVTDIRGSQLPNNGDAVEFESTEGKKGKAAANVTIISKAAVQKTAKVECPKCHTVMVPRLVTSGGHAYKQLCVSCGATLKSFTARKVTKTLWIIIGVTVLWFFVLKDLPQLIKLLLTMSSEL